MTFSGLIRGRETEVFSLSLAVSGMRSSIKGGQKGVEKGGGVRIWWRGKEGGGGR